MKRLFLLSLLALGLAWAALFAMSPNGAQRRIFLECAKCEWSDFRITRTFYDAPDPYENTHQLERALSCYPFIAFETFRWFPNTPAGGVAYACIGACLLLIAMFAVNEAANGADRLILAPALALSAPFVFTLERQNSIFLAAAAVALFIGWWNSDSRTRRFAAAVALGFATAMKISPAILGILYLCPIGGRWRPDWRGIFWSALFALAFLIVPFYISGDGTDAIAKWLRNASEHAASFAANDAWGWTPIWRNLNQVNIHFPYFTCEATKFMNVVSAVICFLGAVFAARSASDKSTMRAPCGVSAFFAVAALLFATPNSITYMALYLLPVALLWLSEADGDTSPVAVACDRTAFVCWLLVLLPIQIPAEWLMNAPGMTLNFPIANMAFMMLVVIAFVRTGHLLHNRRAQATI